MSLCDVRGCVAVAEVISWGFVLLNLFVFLESENASALFRGTPVAEAMQRCHQAQWGTTHPLSRLTRVGVPRAPRSSVGGFLSSL